MEDKKDGKVAAYVLYLNPLEEYRDALHQFYEKSKDICRNKAHDYFPHATLTSFQLSGVVKTVNLILQ